MFTPVCTELALRKVATQQEVMEAIWVASEMRAGDAYAHSNLASDTMKRVEARRCGAKATDAT